MLDPVAASKTSVLSGIRAISFDGDDTLWDFQSAMLHGLGCVLGEIRRRVPGEAALALTVQHLRALRDAAEAEMAGATLEAIRLEGLRRAVAAAGLCGEGGTLAQTLFELYVQERSAALHPYPDAEPALRALGVRYPLAVISNGNTDVVRAGLTMPFALLLYAAEVGLSKPDPRIFHLACRRLGCAPCELLHVGDSLESDVAGAQAAGVLSVWLNRAEPGAPVAHRTPSGAEPDLTVTTLLELVPLLT